MDLPFCIYIEGYLENMRALNEGESVDTSNVGVPNIFTFVRILLKHRQCILYRSFTGVGGGLKLLGRVPQASSSRTLQYTSLCTDSIIRL